MYSAQACFSTLHHNLPRLLSTLAVCSFFLIFRLTEEKENEEFSKKSETVIYYSVEKRAVWLSLCVGKKGLHTRTHTKSFR